MRYSQDSYPAVRLRTRHGHGMLVILERTYSTPSAECQATNQRL